MTWPVLHMYTLPLTLKLAKINRFNLLCSINWRLHVIINDKYEQYCSHVNCFVTNCASIRARVVEQDSTTQHRIHDMEMDTQNIDELGIVSVFYFYFFCIFCVFLSIYLSLASSMQRQSGLCTACRWEQWQQRRLRQKQQLHGIKCNECASNFLQTISVSSISVCQHFGRNDFRLGNRHRILNAISMCHTECTIWQFCRVCKNAQHTRPIITSTMPVGRNIDRYLRAGNHLRVR